ncbi:MAG TPA: hypothetical protein VMT90_08035, partial [Dehalococcoidia bacterium]|nr:hypothetical protein [Dehalococcoidia bacterium]
MIRIALLAIFLLAGYLAVSERHDASAAYAGRNGLIVYDHEGDLWTINPDGSGKTNITNNDEFDHDPSW